MKLPFMVGLTALLLIAADAPKSDKGKLQGRWYGGVWVWNGPKTLVVDMNDPVSVLDITEDTVNLRYRTGTSKCWSYSVASNGTPTAIDLADKGETQLAIYKIEPNRHGGYCLTICVAKPGADRPSEFLHEPERGLQLHSFARYPNFP